MNARAYEGPVGFNLKKSGAKEALYLTCVHTAEFVQQEKGKFFPDKLIGNVILGFLNEALTKTESQSEHKFLAQAYFKTDNNGSHYFRVFLCVADNNCKALRIFHPRTLEDLLDRGSLQDELLMCGAEDVRKDVEKLLAGRSLLKNYCFPALQQNNTRITLENLDLPSNSFLAKMDVLAVCKSADHSKVSQAECVLRAFGTNNHHLRFARLLPHFPELKRRIK